MLNRSFISQYIFSMSLALLIVGSAHSQQLVLGPEQFKEDQSGHGAVLCSWSIYIEIQTHSALCNLERTASDDAIDQAILNMDKFIIANSSLHPTQEMLNNFKKTQVISIKSRVERIGLDKSCRNRDVEVFRKAPPGKIDESVNRLLSTPREPTMNPCL